MTQDARNGVTFNNWLNHIEDGETPSLEEFSYWYEYDPNLVWRIHQGHIVNLLDDALERLGLLK